jgi:RNA polymerase sigma factor (TIGR02999 family)
MAGDEDSGTRHDITALLRQAADGNASAFDTLLPLVYEELKRLAGSKLRLERDGHTLNATALVHEAYLQLVDQTQIEWQSRSHFFAIASRAMRRILIDYAKMKKAAKRGGGAPSISLDAAAEFLSDEQADELVALDDALEELATFDERGAKVVQYRFFGGLSNQEIADLLGTSEVTVRRSWTMSKAWLRRELSNSE